ncbi:MAG TPA: 50S ribosomal protein L17 [Thermoanaerobaculia bacterium]|nr:50S ribosomal protein L17 [Thermoanaerobaculia bacterium]
MRHGMVNRKLGRTSAHRNALFRNQLASLIDRERIITTLPKAKELRPQIERLVTLARTDSVHNRRQAVRVVDEGMVAKLFENLGPRFADRPGGYTRIIKLGPRRGDAAEMCILEFVGYQIETETKAEETPAKARKAAPKKEPKAKAKAEPDEDEEEAPKKSAKKPAKKAAAPKKAAAKEKPKKTTTKKKSGK